MSKKSEPFVPLISHWNALRRPSASRVASERAGRGRLELHRRLHRVVDLTTLDEREEEASTVSISPTR